MGGRARGSAVTCGCNNGFHEMGKDPADIQANLTPSGQSFPQSPLMVLFPAPCACIYVVRLPGARKFIARLDAGDDRTWRQLHGLMHPKITSETTGYPVGVVSGKQTLTN